MNGEAAAHLEAQPVIRVRWSDGRREFPAKSGRVHRVFDNWQRLFITRKTPDGPGHLAHHVPVVDLFHRNALRHGGAEPVDLLPFLFLGTTSEHVCSGSVTAFGIAHRYGRRPTSRPPSKNPNSRTFRSLRCLMPVAMWSSGTSASIPQGHPGAARHLCCA